MSENENLALIKLKEMNKHMDNKESVLTNFKKAYMGWAYGNGYGLSKNTIACFRQWSGLKESQREEVINEFLSDD